MEDENVQEAQQEEKKLPKQYAYTASKYRKDLIRIGRYKIGRKAKLRHKKMKRFIKAYWITKSNVAQSSLYADIVTSTFSLWYGRYKDFTAIIDSIDDEFIYFAEAKLKQLVNGSDLEAIKFYLSRKGKKKGYGDEIKLKGDPDNPVAQTNNYFTGVEFVITDEIEREKTE